MRKITVRTLKHPIFLHPRSALRRKKFCRSLCIPRHLKGLPALPTPPATIDWSKGRQLTCPIDGNDQYGDCEYAAACHASNLMTGNVGDEDSFDEQAIIAAYLQLAGGDNGLATDTMMDEWKQGLVGGPHQILQDLAVDPNDPEAMALALWLFGGIFFTLGIPDAWLAGRVGPGQVWDGGRGVVADDMNGHAVLLSGRNARGYSVETWAITPPIIITQAGVQVCDPEATCYFSLDWFDAAGNAPNGMTYDQLAALWVQLGGRPLPPFGPVPPPPPPPLAGYSVTLAGGVPDGTYILTPTS